MCGIAGFVEIGVSASSVAGEAASHRFVQRAAEKLRHRGPDGQGTFLDPSGRAAFAHRRLAVLDLTAAGDQPMQCPCDRYVIVFNGEIYNFRTLRQSLQAQGHEFRGNSDTEVIQTLFVQLGPACVSALQGMFAFAVWDMQDQTSFLARRCELTGYMRNQLVVTGQRRYEHGVGSGASRIFC